MKNTSFEVSFCTKQANTCSGSNGTSSILNMSSLITIIWWWSADCRSGSRLGNVTVSSEVCVVCSLSRMEKYSLST